MKNNWGQILPGGQSHQQTMTIHTA